MRNIYFSYLIMIYTYCFKQNSILTAMVIKSYEKTNKKYKIIVKKYFEYEGQINNWKAVTEVQHCKIIGCLHVLSREEL